MIDTLIDQTNINHISRLIERNNLKTLELVNFLNGQPKMLSLSDLLTSLYNKESLQFLSIKDPYLKLTETLIKAA